MEGEDTVATHESGIMAAELTLPGECLPVQADRIAESPGPGIEFLDSPWVREGSGPGPKAGPLQVVIRLGATEQAEGAVPGPQRLLGAPECRPCPRLDEAGGRVVGLAIDQGSHPVERLLRGVAIELQLGPAQCDDGGIAARPAGIPVVGEGPVPLAVTPVGVGPPQEKFRISRVRRDPLPEETDLPLELLVPPPRAGEGQPGTEQQQRAHAHRAGSIQKPTVTVFEHWAGSPSSQSW